MTSLSRPGVQASIRTFERDGRLCVLKSPRGGLLSPISCWTISREHRVYQRLDGVPGVPKSFGLTDEGLVLEAVAGRPLSEFRKGEISAEFLDRLDRILAAIHERGVAHSDLKKRDNIIVSGESNPSPVILDFGAAFLKGELLFETFRRVDLAAAAKLRAHHQPGTMRPEQRAILENPTWAEKLSRFLIRTVRDPYRLWVGSRIHS